MERLAEMRGEQTVFNPNAYFGANDKHQRREYQQELMICAKPGVNPHWRPRARVLVF